MVLAENLLFCLYWTIFVDNGQLAEQLLLCVSINMLVKCKMFYVLSPGLGLYGVLYKLYINLPFHRISNK
jgi:hypothetical protein